MRLAQFHNEVRTARFVSELLLKLPATLDSSAWYFGNMLAIVAVVVALASWSVYTVVPRSG